MENTEETKNLPLLQKTQLKVQALLETTSELQNQIAEYRAEVTMLSAELNRVNTEKAYLEAQQEATDEPVEEADAAVSPATEA